MRVCVCDIQERMEGDRKRSGEKVMDSLFLPKRPSAPHLNCKRQAKL